MRGAAFLELFYVFAFYFSFNLYEFELHSFGGGVERGIFLLILSALEPRKVAINDRHLINIC